MGTIQLDLAIHISCLRCHLSRQFKLRKHTSTLQKPSDCNRESTRIVYCIRPITDQPAIYIDLHNFSIQNFRFYFPTFSERVLEEKKAKVSRLVFSSLKLQFRNLGFLSLIFMVFLLSSCGNSNVFLSLHFELYSSIWEIRVYCFVLYFSSLSIIRTCVVYSLNDFILNSISVYNFFRISYMLD